MAGLIGCISSCSSQNASSEIRTLETNHIVRSVIESSLTLGVELRGSMPQVQVFWGDLSTHARYHSLLGLTTSLGQGCFRIEVDRSVPDWAFAGILAHETMHTLRPSLHDLYFEGLASSIYWWSVESVQACSSSQVCCIPPGDRLCGAASQNLRMYKSYTAGSPSTISSNMLRAIASRVGVREVMSMANYFSGSEIEINEWLHSLVAEDVARHLIREWWPILERTRKTWAPDLSLQSV